MLKENDSLWCRILHTEYKNRVHPNDSWWWRYLNSMCFGIDHGRWFSEAVCRRVGDERDVPFWDEDWSTKISKAIGSFMLK